MTERWIFGFRRCATRELADEERGALRAAAKRCNIARIGRGLAAVVTMIAALSGIAFASSGSWWGWLVLLGGTIAFFWLLSLASEAERMALLAKRARRVAHLDVFERLGAPESVRDRYTAREADGESLLGGSYWESEERFEKELFAIAGKAPIMIETPAADDVLLYVDGRLVPRAIGAPVITLTPGE